MVEHQSKEVVDKMSRDLKIQPAMQLPREIAKAIQPTFNVNPERLMQIRTAVASDAASATIFQTHATKDTFLVAASLSVAKDAVGASLFSAVRIPMFDGTVRDALLIRYEPTTAGDFYANLPSIPPILLNKSANVQIINQAATASIDSAASIIFFEVDPQ